VPSAVVPRQDSNLRRTAPETDIPYGLSFRPGLRPVSARAPVTLGAGREGQEVLLRVEHVIRFVCSASIVAVSR